MKRGRNFLLALTLIFAYTGLFAGGIVTNTNQSAEFIRTMNRNASTDMDAVYFNPAAVATFTDGLHAYLSNQTIFQTRKITTYFPAYNSSTFDGETTAPVFPNVYLAYNMGNLAFSLGVMPIGGGGSAEFPKGLPLFDYQLARFVGLPSKLIDPALEPYGNITGYSVNASFTGSSVYIGGQAGVAYQFSPALSFAAGLRLVSAKNTYEGSLTDVVLNAQNGDIVGVIPDIHVDAMRTGMGYTGIVGFNYSPAQTINIAFRYETKTSLELTTDTKVDETAILGDPMFPDGEKIPADMPAMIAAGASYNLTQALRAEGSFSYYFNNGVKWENDSQENVDNSVEYGLALEYAVSPKIDLSLGGLVSNMNAKPAYQTDISNSIDSKSLGTGVRYHLSEMLSFSLGLSNTFYDTAKNSKTGVFAEEYGKTSIVYAVGFQYGL